MKQIYPKALKPISLIRIVTVLMLFLAVFKGIALNNTHFVRSDVPGFQVLNSGNKAVLTGTQANQTNDKEYRIQVCASRFMLPDIKQLEKQCGQSNLSFEEIGGYYKYFTPVNSNHDAILKTLSEIKAKPGFEGSFIVVNKGAAKANIQTIQTTQTTPTTPVKKEISVPVTSKVVAVAKTDLPHAFIFDTTPPVAKNQISFIDTSLRTDSTSKAALTKIRVKDSRKSPVPFKTGFTNKFNIPSLVIFFLILFSLGFLVLGILLILKVFTTMERSEESIVIGELYAEQLAVYLNDQRENTPVPELIKAVKTSFQKDILISEIIDFYDMLPHDSGKKVRDLYFKLELDYYSSLKLSNRKWNVKARGIYELYAMNAHNEVDSIAELINHPHPVIRHEAIAASVKLCSDDPFGFLDRLKVPLTKRDKINAYTLLWKQHYAIPGFSRWFDSTNTSVVQFAVEMVSMNRQIESVAGFDKLLRHYDEGVRESVIKAIGELYLTTYSNRLITLFDDEHEHTELLILQTMSRLQDPALLNFLGDTVLYHPFMKIRVEAAKALVNIGSQGLARMQSFLLNADHDITYIYKQIIQS
jgi:HEAT repeat protein